MQDWYWYEPERVPLVHVLLWLVQLEPYGTVLAWYAVMEVLCAVVPPQGREHDWYTVSEAELELVPPEP